VFLEHRTSPGHPECSERLGVTIQHLKQQSWFDSLTHLAPRTAELDWIESVHSLDYIKRAKATCQSGNDFLDSMDVSICPRSYDIALMATGAVLEIADKVINKEIDNGLALIRPPGHHAEQDQALGFCLFNNVAILAKYLQKQYQLDKILILDWDVHHGNGTQHSFDSDPSVLYISTHQYPFYPGTGAYSETGISNGVGATLNCPMPAGANDNDYELAFKDKILPRIDEFKPEAVIISAGFDAHIDDPLGQVNLSTEFYAWMTERVMEKAEQYSGGRIISVLEGGYNLNMLPRCIEKHLSTLNSYGM
jgi:acetoin utilization deacetylase AcuC-like enzyme